MPRILDTEAQFALLERLGVKVQWSGENEIRLQADAVVDTEVDEGLSARIRASFLLAGPLLARFGEARMPPPGGDFIGRRRLDPHLDAFRDMGARVDGDRWIEIDAPGEGLKPCAVFMDEPSVMGTENALMAAALTPGPTTIANAACERILLMSPTSPRILAARIGPMPSRSVRVVSDWASSSSIRAVVPAISLLKRRSSPIRRRASSARTEGSPLTNKAALATCLAPTRFGTRRS